MKENIEVKDFLDYTFLSDLKTAPDERHMSYIVSTCDEEHNQYRSCLHVSDGEKSFALTSHGKEQLYIWDDENTILFANMREHKDIDAVKHGEEKTIFYHISMHGGEAQKAFCIPLHVIAIKKITASEYVCLIDYDLRYSHMYALDEEGRNAILKEKESMQDYEVLDELPFYGNGAGYTNKKRNVLFLYNKDTEELSHISDILSNVGIFEIDPTHKKVYYTGEAYTQKPSYKDGIFVYDMEKKCSKEVLKAEVYAIRDLKVWNDNVLVVASDQRHYGANENGKFYMLDFEKKDLVFLAEYEDAIGSTVGSDCRYGSGKAMKVYNDRVYFLTTLYNRSVVYALASDGCISAVYEAEGSVDDFDIMHEKLYFIGMQDLRLQEVYAGNLQGKGRTQVSLYNEKFYKEKDVRPCVSCRFENNGVELYGWVLEPSNYDSTKSYPAILDIHGGPKTVYGEVFYHEMQVWANKGYFVFFMNPRGGDGRGNVFADLRGKYGTIDYDDIMKFTDTVLAKYPAIDEKRLGVTGGSYGGFMTNWIITHTNRFKAAASQRSIANWISFAHTSDIGEIFGSDQQGGNIWKNQDKLWWHSPLKYADKCTTPTLFIHSDEDYRCPYSEGLQMYSALCEHGVKTRLCMFKGENHELSRSGKPKHRVKRLEEITSWMDEHLES